MCREVVDRAFDEVYQLAADMGGAGYIFTGENDADIMHNSATINLNMSRGLPQRNVKRIFYSSSACMYPAYNQLDPDNPNCAEDSAYPAAPDSEYGWEKLFSERLYLAYNRNHGMECRVARYHNIFGPEGTWTGGKEKAPAALCRKVAEAEDGGEIEIWGDGQQTRSFLYIDECLEGTLRLMRSRLDGPVQHRIGGDGHDQPACRHGHGHRRQEADHEPHPRPARRARPQFRQPADQGGTGLGAVATLRAGLEKTYAWIEAQVLRNVARQ